MSDRVGDITDAVERSYERIEATPSYWELWCESCGWHAAMWTECERDVRSEVHQQTCPSPDGSYVMQERRIVMGSTIPDELGKGVDDDE